MYFRYGVLWGVFSRCLDGNFEYGCWCGVFCDDFCVEVFKKDVCKKMLFLVFCGMVFVVGYLVEVIFVF